MAKKTAKAKPDSKAPIKQKKAVIKTQATKESVVDFVNSVSDVQKRNDSFTIIEMMKKLTKEEPVLWGAGLIGFGNITVTSERTGRTVDWFKIGFAPRKANLSLYLGIDISIHGADLKKLGKYKTNGGCLYINKLEDVDMKVLEGMMKRGGFK